MFSVYGSMHEEKNTASFRFHGALQDFLKKRERGQPVTYNFHGAPAVKDAIEAIGVPHSEVDVVLLNQQPVNFQQAISAGDEVEVFPVDAKYDWPDGYSFSKTHPAPNKFILDVHLGTLAKNLRMLGFDTFYQTDLSDNTIAQLAEQQQLVVLTRDIGLLKHKAITWGYWLRSQHTQEQLEEVIAHFDLWHSFRPFTLCLECNSPLQPVNKQDVLELLPPKTRLYFNEFYQCPTCKRVYWKGSHYERMQSYIEQISQRRNS